MAQLVGGVVGAAVGWFVGGPTGAAWGWSIGAGVGGYLGAPDVEGPRLNDLRITGTEYGQPIPWVAGSPRIAGQIVWASNKRETANTQSAKGGPEQTTYTYDCDLLILLTENETIAGVSRIWSNGELVWGNGQTKSGVWGGLTVYTGAEDQMPDPVYEAAVGAGNAPAYRGRGYVVIQALQLGGNGQIPNLTFEIGWPIPVAPLSDYFYAGYPETVNDLACSSNVDVQGALTSTSVITSPNALTVRNNGWSFGDVVARGYFYKFNSGLIFPGAELRIDFKFSAITPLTNYVSSSDVMYFQSSTAGAIGYPSTTFFVKVGFNATTGFVNKISLNSLGFGVIDYEGFLDGSELDVTVQMIYATSTLNFYVNGVLVGTKTFSYKMNQHTILLGGHTSTNRTSGFFFADITYKNLRVRIGDAGDIVRPYVAPDCSPFVYGRQGTEPIYGTIDRAMIRSGYISADYDISDVQGETKPVRGMALGQIAGTRSTLEMLQSAWFLEASKSDRIYIRPRAITPVATIPWADLGASEDAVSDAEPLALTMANDLEIPGQIALSYPNMAGDYQTATEHSDRLLSGQESVQAMQMPLGMLPAEAKALADALLFDQVAGMTKTTIRLPLRYAYIEPGDVIEAVNFDGRSYRLRVQVKRDTLSIIELDCVLDDVGALDSAAVTDTGYISTTEPVRVAPTVFEALDIPLLRDADNSPGYYVAVGAQRESADDEWKGALVARSWDDTSYAELFRTTDEGVLATCSTTLGDWTGGNVWDESNTLTVVTSGGELASSTRSAMQADETLNVLAVGSQATGWELLRFRRAELTAPNTYVLSGLLRGFRGSEWRMGSHAAGEQAVLLDAALRRATSQTSQIGLARYIKAVTFGQILANVDSEAFTDTGEALRPWSPAHPVVLADDDGDLVLTWQRRTRLSYRYDGDSPAVPLGEAAELYRARVYDGATLVRTATATEPIYLYTAAEQAADGFAPGDPVTFEICQVSETVGAGRPAICTGVAP